MASPKRRRIAELQKLVAAERAAVQGADNRTKELNDAHRILAAATQCSKLSALFASVRDLPDDQGERLVADHASADRAQKLRLTQLERQLASQSERQRQLQLQLEQVRDEIPSASQARQQLRRVQNNKAVQSEYTAMLQQYGDLTHLYNVLEKLMVTSDYPWLDSADWMERIRPAYHALPPPSHVMRADLAASSAEASGSEGSSPRDLAEDSGSEDSSPP